MPSKQETVPSLAVMSPAQQREAIFSMTRRVAQDPARFLAPLQACVADPSPVVCSTVLTCLQELVMAKVIPRDKVLRDLVARIPAIPINTLHLVCASALWLATLEPHIDSTESLHAHPFVAIITARPDALGPCTAIAGEYLCSSNDTTNSAGLWCLKLPEPSSSHQPLEWLLPFMLYVLMDCNTMAHAKMTLFRTLLREAPLQTQVLRLLMWLLPAVPDPSSTAVPTLREELSRGMTELTLAPSTTHWPASLRALFLHLLSMSSEYMRCRWDAARPLSMALQIVTAHPEVLFDAHAAGASGTLLLLSLLLSRAQTDQQQAILLQLADVSIRHVMHSSHVSHVALYGRFLCVPLLGILATATSSIHHPLAAQIFEAIITPPSNTISQATPPVAPLVIPPTLLQMVCRADAMALHFCNVVLPQILAVKEGKEQPVGGISDSCLSKNYNVNIAAGLQWMTNMVPPVAEGTISNDGDDVFFSVIVGFLLLLPIPEIHVAEWTKCALDAIKRCATTYCTAGPRLLPVLMYLLNSEQCISSLKLALLHALPHIGPQDWVGTGPVMKLVSQLLNVSGLRSIALQQLSSICLRQPKAFATLFNALQQPAADKEEELSMALAIQAICEKFAQQGADLVPHLSRMLTTETDPRCVVVGLQALGSLCEHGVVGFSDSWHAIRRMVLAASGRSILVRRALCRFFVHCANDLRQVGQPLLPTQNLTGEVVQEGQVQDEEQGPNYDIEVREWLWQAASDQDEEVQRTAFQTISTFPVEFLASAFLEPDAPTPNDIHKEQQQRRQLFAKLSGHVMDRLNDGPCHGWETLAKVLWDTEIQGLASQRRALPPEKTAFQPSTEKIAKQLSEEYEKGAVVSPACCLATLSCYQPSSVKGRDPAQHFDGVAADIFRGCPHYPSVLFNVLLAQAWADFAVQYHGQYSLAQSLSPVDSLREKFVQQYSQLGFHAAIHSGYGMAGIAQLPSSNSSSVHDEFVTKLLGMEDHWATLAGAVASSSVAIKGDAICMQQTISGLLMPLKEIRDPITLLQSSVACGNAFAAGSLCLFVTQRRLSLFVPRDNSAHQLNSDSWASMAVPQLRAAWDLLNNFPGSMKPTHISKVSMLALGLAWMAIASVLGAEPKEMGSRAETAILTLHTFDAAVQQMEDLLLNCTSADGLCKAVVIGSAAVLGYAALCPALIDLRLVPPSAAAAATDRLVALLTTVQALSFLNMTEVYTNVCGALGYLLHQGMDCGFRGRKHGDIGKIIEEQLLAACLAPTAPPEARMSAVLGIGFYMGLPLMPYLSQGDTIVQSNMDFRKLKQRIITALHGVYTARGDPVLKASVALVLSRLISRKAPEAALDTGATPGRCPVAVGQCQSDGLLRRVVQCLEMWPFASTTVSQSVQPVLSLVASLDHLPHGDWGFIIHPFLVDTQINDHCLVACIHILGCAAVSTLGSARTLLLRLCQSPNFCRLPDLAQDALLHSAARLLQALPDLAPSSLLLHLAHLHKYPDKAIVELFGGIRMTSAETPQVPKGSLSMFSHLFVALKAPLIEDSPWAVAVDWAALSHLRHTLQALHDSCSADEVRQFLAEILITAGQPGSLWVVALSQLLLVSIAQATLQKRWKENDQFEILNSTLETCLRSADASPTLVALVGSCVAVMVAKMSTAVQQKILMTCLQAMADTPHSTGILLITATTIVAISMPLVHCAITRSICQLLQSTDDGPSHIAIPKEPLVFMAVGLQEIRTQWQVHQPSAAKKLEDLLSRIFCTTPPPKGAEEAGQSVATLWLIMQAHIGKGTSAACKMARMLKELVLDDQQLPWPPAF